MPLTPQQLQKFIEEPKNGILLTPERFGYGGDALFQLGPWRYQSRLIWLPGLLRHVRQDDSGDQGMFFQVCSAASQRISSLNTELKQSGLMGLDRILACSPVAKLVAEHAVSECSEIQLSISYLNDLSLPLCLRHESQTFDGSTAPFQGERVLILMDLFADEDFHSRVLKTIDSLGGSVAGTLCLVFSPNPRRSAPGLDVTYLSKLPIEQLQAPNGYDVCRVHPFSTRPLAEAERSERRDPLFDFVETAAILRRLNAISFGLFQADNRLHTTRVDVDKLVNDVHVFDRVVEQLIGQVVPVTPARRFAFRIPFFPWRRNGTRHSSHAQPSTLTVTLSSQEDLLFCTRVHTSLRRKKLVDDRVIVALKCETVDETFEYQFTPDDVASIVGRPVLVLLSSVNTGEKVRNLADTLAAAGATSILFVTFISRLGVSTATFLDRLDKLVAGPSFRRSSLARIRFVTCFEIPELPLDDLRQMQGTVLAAARHFTEYSDYEEFLEEFSQRLLRFARGLPVHAAPAVLTPQPNLDVALAVAKMVRDNDVSDVSTILNDCESHDILITLTLVVLANVDTLRANSCYELIRDLLVNRYKSIRESSDHKAPTDVDASLLFCISVFLLFDKSLDLDWVKANVIEPWFQPLDTLATSDYSRFLQELNKTSTTLLPAVITAFFGFNSTLANAKELTTYVSDEAEALRARLRDPTVRHEPRDVQSAENNVNQLLLRLDYYTASVPNTIEFLQHQLLFKSPNHNPISSSITEIRNVLEGRVLVSFNEEHQVCRADPDAARRLRRELARAGILTVVAKGVEYLLHNAPQLVTSPVSHVREQSPFNGQSRRHVAGLDEGNVGGFVELVRTFFRQCYYVAEGRETKRDSIESLLKAADEIQRQLYWRFVDSSEEVSEPLRSTDLDIERMPIVKSVSLSLTSVCKCVNDALFRNNDPEVARFRHRAGISAALTDKPVMIMAFEPFYIEALVNLLRNAVTHWSPEHGAIGIDIIVPKADMQLYGSSPSVQLANSVQLFGEKVRERDVSVRIWNETDAVTQDDVTAIDLSTIRKDNFVASLLGGSISQPRLNGKRVEVEISAISRPRFVDFGEKYHAIH